MSEPVSDRSGDPSPTSHHLEVTRTARYCTLGSVGPETREVWFACHGYGQLAAHFLTSFRQLAHGTRYLVAPEALSRFYLAASAGRDPKARIGATWMTREDRLAEIRDYVAYLDLLYERVMTDLPSAVRVVALGFSQGVATVCRWITQGRARVDDLVLWGERLPPDLDLAEAAPILRSVRLTLVAGRADPLVPGQALAEEESRLERQGISYRLRVFEGGHQLDAGVLQAIARGD